MNKEELSKVIENHKHWLNEDCDNWKDMRANLYGANLSGANLHVADLSGANLSGANLSGADLSGADLRGADLSGVDLDEANLSGADLYVANLYGAALRGANLSGANLHGANLSVANLYETNLSGVDLDEANLYKAYLSEAKNIPFIPYACPDYGTFIGYKKARNGYIVELEILEDARRVSATSRKCRCDKAKVLRILNTDRTVASVDEVRSKYDAGFFYRTGEIVFVDDFDENRWNECGTGIHFFVNFQEAVNY